MIISPINSQSKLIPYSPDLVINKIFSPIIKMEKFNNPRNWINRFCVKLTLDEMLLRVRTKKKITDV